VTSPPYPMIAMWDDLFTQMSPKIGKQLDNKNGNRAFELMHQELDKVWKEIWRVAKNNSFVCINIGDAARTIDNRFQLYSNHSRIISAMKNLGFDTLPVILWRKTTNAPNKFMGSGMLPSGAYVTLEHEYILIFRKGNKRTFSAEKDKAKRMESSFFWEERNSWFSDIWNFKGTLQKIELKDLRARSAAFPFELAFRLVNMYSLQQDTVLDPFLGTGTTAHACIAAGRNSIGIEIDKNFSKLIFRDPEEIKLNANQLASNRITTHIKFMEDYESKKGPAKHSNSRHGFPVVTKQETKMVIYNICDIFRTENNSVKAVYKPAFNTGSL